VTAVDAVEGVLQGFITGVDCRLPRWRPDLRPWNVPRARSLLGHNWAHHVRA